MSGIRLLTQERKAAKPKNHPGRLEIKRIIKEDIVDSTTQALCIVLYLTGCRITEVVGRKKEVQAYYYKKEKKEQVLNPIAPMKVASLKLERDGERKTWMFKDLPVLKRKEAIERDVYVSPRDNDLVDMLLAYVKQKELTKEDVLFPFYRRKAWELMINAFGKEQSGVLKRPLFNHWWRHQCATDKVKEEGFDALALVNFMDWANIKHAQKYAEMNKKDLRDRLWKNYEDNKTKKALLKED